jgi:hypothetical protein
LAKEEMPGLGRQGGQITSGEGSKAAPASIVGGVIRARLDAVEMFMNFVYLWSEDDSSESVIEEVPNGVAAAMDGVLGVEVATDTSPLRVRVELHDQQPPLVALAAGEDVAVLTWRPCGTSLRLADTVGHEVEGLELGPGDGVLAVEVRCRGRDEANQAGVGELEEPVEEILIRLWPGPASEDKLIARQSSFGRMLAGEPPPPSGPAPPLVLGNTAVIPAYYWRFYLRDEGVPAPWQLREPMGLGSALVNGLVSNLPGLAEVKTGTRTGEVDLRVRVVGRQAATVADALAVASSSGLPVAADAVAVTHHTNGNILVADTEDNADHYRFEVPAGEVGLLVVAWDRDAAARRRNAETRELIDLVFWTGESPGEQIIQAASTFGQEMADTDKSIRQQLD